MNILARSDGFHVTGYDFHMDLAQVSIYENQKSQFCKEKSRVILYMFKPLTYVYAWLSYENHDFPMKLLIFQWKSWFSYENPDFHRKIMIFIGKSWFCHENHDFHNFHMKIIIFIRKSWFSKENRDFLWRVWFSDEKHAFHKKIMIWLI